MTFYSINRLPFGFRAKSSRISLSLWTLLLAALLTGCTGALPAAPTGVPQEAVQPEITTIAPTPVPSEAPGPQSGARQLVVWLPAFSGLAGEESAGDILASAFRQFEQNHPGVRVDVDVKAETGPASLFSYLRSAQRVAPSVLPDIILINTQSLWQLVDLGLVPPLPEDQTGRAGDFYQFSLDAVRYGGQIYGIPYAADTIHLAFPTGQLDKPPTTWGELFAGGLPYYFATAGGDLYHNGSVLLQYVGAGGQLLEDGSTSNDEALRALFDFIVEGRIRNTIPASVAEIATLDAVWSRVSGAEPALGNVAAAVYLTNRDVAPQVLFGQTPTRHGLPVTIASTWAFAILTPDEEQRSLAVGLIDTLLEPDVQGAWSQYSHRLPTRRTAIQAWVNPTPYLDFLNRQLEVAVALPNGRAFADFAHRMQDAERGLVLGELTPEQAVQMVTGVE